MTIEAVRPPGEVPVSKEQLLAMQFHNMLTEVESAHVINTPIHLDTENPIGDSVNGFLYTERQAGTHIYLSSEFAELVDAGMATFVHRQSRAGKRSAHGVFFGDILFDNGAVVSVAVKPHEDESLVSCATDYFTNEGVKRMGVESLRSLGMLIGSDGRAYSMTLREDINTLDNINFFRLAEQAPEGFQNIWSQVARQAAMLHASGRASHNDYAARNIALRPDGTVFGLDWEKADLSTLPARDAEVRYAHSYSDMNELMESLVRDRRDKFKGGIGLLTQHKQPWEAFRALVFDEYVDTRIGFASDKDRRDVKDELQELENSLKANMQRLLRAAGRDITL